MGKLLDFAKSVASEKSLHGRLGRWILEVSRALDSQGADTPVDYIQVGYTAPQTVIVGNVIAPDTVLERQGITYSQGLFRLLAGKVYHLTASGRFTSFAGGEGAGMLTLEWHDAATHAYGTRMVVEPHTAVTAATNAPVAEAIIVVPPGDLILALVCVSGDGSAVIEADAFSIVITEIR